MWFLTDLAELKKKKKVRGNQVCYLSFSTINSQISAICKYPSKCWILDESIPSVGYFCRYSYIMAMQKECCLL